MCRRAPRPSSRAKLYFSLRTYCSQEVCNPEFKICNRRSRPATWKLPLENCYLYSMATVKITVRPNGPYRVEAPEGSIELVDAQGNKYDLTGKPAFSLCRCGGSVNKPFCDGTHSKIGFQGAELAVRKADEPGNA
jgi:CDGSH-type Zn-finger protein